MDKDIEDTRPYKSSGVRKWEGMAYIVQGGLALERREQVDLGIIFEIMNRMWLQIPQDGENIKLENL